MTATIEKTHTAYSSCHFTPYWSQMYNLFVEGSEIPSALYSKAYQSLLDLSIETQQSFHSLLRKFLALALVNPQEPAKKKLLDLFFMMQKKASAFETSLYLAYCPILMHLLEVNSSISLALVSKSETPDATTPSIQAEKALLCFLRGVLTQDPELIQQGINYTYEQAIFIDGNQDLFKGAIRAESHDSDQAILALYGLLFSVASFFLAEDSYLSELNKHFSSTWMQSSSLSEQDGCFVYPMLYAFFQRSLKAAFPLAQHIFETPSIAHNLSFARVKHTAQHSAFLCSALGNGLGFAFMKKHHVEFLSIGPQIGTVGEMSGFGIAPSFKKTSEYADNITTTSSVKGFYFSTWLPCMHTVEKASSASKTWIHVNALCEEQKLDLSLKVLHVQESQEVSLVFFVKADKVIVDQMIHLQPHTLDRYEGKAASLQFFKGKQPVTLEASLDGVMKVIPLSGQEHFWGAEFLIAYTLPQDQLVSFKID